MEGVPEQMHWGGGGGGKHRSFYQGDQIRETGWGGACRMHSCISKCIEVLVRTHEGKRLFGRPRCRW